MEESIAREDSGAQRAHTPCSDHATEVAEMAPKFKLASPGMLQTETRRPGGGLEGSGGQNASRACSKPKAKKINQRGCHVRAKARRSGVKARNAKGKV